MNYEKLYNAIIEKRKLNIPNGYTEEHHILPRSLGGTDDKSNLVKLTAKEHFICHLLLTKMYPKGSNEYYKMSHAFLMMLVSSKDHKGQRYITSRKYEYLKVSFSERMSVLQSGESNSQYGMMWIHNKTLKQCKKVPKDSIIEEGWEKGRVLVWDKIINEPKPRLKNTPIMYSFICQICNVNFKSREKVRKVCSNKCLRTLRIQLASAKNRKKVLDDKGNTYDSMKEAGLMLGVTPECVYYRIKNGIYHYAGIDQSVESDALEAS